MADKPKEKEKQEHLCMGPVCNGNKNAVTVKGIYCSECNNAITLEIKLKKFE